MKVTVCGAGAYGKALGKVLRVNKHKVTYYDPYVFPELGLAEALAEAEAVVIAVPAEVIDGLLVKYPLQAKRLPTLLATKGLLDLDRFAGFLDFGLLAGAAFADDLMSHRSVVLTATTPLAKQIIEGVQVKIEMTDDVEGVLYCGALKNIYAIGAGYSCDDAEEARFYAAQALKELKDYLVAHGAKAETADLSCGWADLKITCTERSRNFRCGRILREGGNLGDAKRSLGTLEGLVALRWVDWKGYPLISFVRELVRR